MLSERDAINKLGGNERSVICLTKFMHRQNVGMVKIRNRACFLSEALQPILIFGYFSRKDFQGDGASKFGSILREVDLTHPTSAEFRDDAVTSNYGVGGYDFGQIVLSLS